MYGGGGGVAGDAMDDMAPIYSVGKRTNAVGHMWERWFMAMHFADVAMNDARLATNANAMNFVGYE